jgi:hypothetical protein
MFEKDAGYPTPGLFRSPWMRSVHQTAAEDPKTPTAKVIFLDAAGRVAVAHSGNVAE